MILVPVLGSALLLALGVMLYALLKKQELTTEVKQLRTTQKEAVDLAEKTSSRVAELERKLARARNVRSETDTAKESLEEAIQKLEDENRQLRTTMERTATRATPAQVDDANELKQEIKSLQKEIASTQKQLTAALDEGKHLEKQVELVRDSVEREAAGASAKYQERVEEIVNRYHAMKKRLLHAERELRVERRLAENNNRAYHITLQQLDLAQDQVYTLQKGKEPTQRKGRLLQSMGLEKAPEVASDEPGEDTTAPDSVLDDTVIAPESSSDTESTDVESSSAQESDDTTTASLNAV